MVALGVRQKQSSSISASAEISFKFGRKFSSIFCTTKLLLLLVLLLMLLGFFLIFTKGSNIFCVFLLILICFFS